MTYVGGGWWLVAVVGSEVCTTRFGVLDGPGLSLRTAYLVEFVGLAQYATSTESRMDGLGLGGWGGGGDFGRIGFSEMWDQNLRCFSNMNLRRALLSTRRDGAAAHSGICQELGTRGNLRDGIFLKTVLAMKF